MSVALILVGGYGTRLRPLTFEHPKPLVPFCNRPILFHQIEALARVGVKTVILAVSYRPQRMEAFVANVRASLGVEVIFQIEDVPLGTAGPLSLARERLSKSEGPFFMLNADVICEFPFERFLRFHQSHGREGTIMVTKVEDPSKYGVVVADERGCIDRFVEKPTKWVGDNINAGIYIFNKSILNRVKPVKMSIEREVFPHCAADNELYCFELPGYWMDVGQPRDFLRGQQLHLNFLSTQPLSSAGKSRGAGRTPKLSAAAAAAAAAAGTDNEPGTLRTGDGFLGNVLVHSTAQIGENCLLGPDVVIGANVRIGNGVRIRGSALFEGVHVSQSALIDTSIIGWGSRIGAWARIEEQCVLGDGVDVADQVLLAAGTRVCPHKGVGKSIREPGTAIL